MSEGFRRRRYTSGVEAARRLEVHPNTIRNWITKGYITVDLSPTGQRRIPTSEVDRLSAKMAADMEWQQS